MSTESVIPPTSDAPADLEFGRDYMRQMNEAEKAGASTSPAEVVPETTELATEAVEPPKADTERDDKGKFKKGNPRHDPAARVAQATAEAATAKAERDAARAEAEDLRRRLDGRDQRADQVVKPFVPAPVQSRDTAAPKLDDFLTEPDPYAALAAATARHEVRQALAEERARVESETLDKANATRFATAMEDDDELPDLMAAADAALVKAGANPQAPFPAVMLDAIKASESGPQIARFLGSHPEELVQLAVMSATLPLTRDAATVVRRLLEATVKASLPASTAAVSTGSAAALPRSSVPVLSPVRTSREPAPVRDPNELEFGREYVRKMNERERKGA